MAIDKAVDSTQLDSDLASVANAIRAKSGTSASLAFPAEFVSAIAAISGGSSGLEYDSGTFTLTSDYGGSTGSYAIPHNLGEIPGLVVVWTDYFDDENHTPEKNTNIGYVYLVGISALPQRLSSSTSTDDGIAAYAVINSGARVINFGVPSSKAYLPTKPTAQEIYLNKKQCSTSCYWMGGITYHWIVVKKWW